MFCGFHIVQPASTKRDGSILIKIDKASLKISLGKTHLVEYRAAKFWLQAEAGFAGTGKNLYWASGRLGTKSHWCNHFSWIKKCSRKENNFNYQNAIMSKQKGRAGLPCHLQKVQKSLAHFTYSWWWKIPWLPVPSHFWILNNMFSRAVRIP